MFGGGSGARWMGDLTTSTVPSLCASVPALCGSVPRRVVIWVVLLVSAFRGLLAAVGASCE